MRIWIINHYAIPPNTAGGTRHYNLAKTLQANGHEVLIIAANYNHFTHTFMVPPKKCGKPDTTFDVSFLWLPVPAYKGNTIARFWNMLMFMQALRKNKFLQNSLPADIIIGSSPHLFAAYGAMQLARKLKSTFVLEIRDLWPESLVDLGRFTHRHPLIKFMSWMERRLYKNADKIISLLPSANRYLLEKGVNPARILWLPNSVDMSNIPRDLEKKPNPKFLVINAGSLGVANDLITVLEAAKILQNQGLEDKISICLIGEGPEKNRLKEIAAHENIRIITFMDAVPKKEIYGILHQADTFLMLLKKSPVFRWGISPNKLFDYLAMSRPIVFGVETPFNPVEQYNAGISIPSSDPKALATAILQLSLLSQAEREAMGARGKAYVLENHDVEKLSAKLEKFICVSE